MQHAKAIEMYIKTSNLHSEFINTMLSMAGGNKPMLDAILAHIDSLQELVKPEPTPAFSIRESFKGMYSPDDLDRENNPSLHKGY
jgi:hypothetical protein